MNHTHFRIVAVSLLFSLALLPAGVARASGAASYAANCGSCHGPEGDADTPIGRSMNIPPLGEVVTDEVIAVVRNDPRHKALSAQLDDATLAEIAAYVEHTLR
jgi:mono/diheme cytochrome c family protein